MRYTLLIYTNEADRPQWGTAQGDAEAKGYNEFHGEVTLRGVFRAGEPLQRVADATSVRVRNGDTQISDGPAVQSPEQLGGWYLLECDDLDQALELAAKIPGASYGTIEVRPVLELPPSSRPWTVPGQPGRGKSGWLDRVCRNNRQSGPWVAVGVDGGCGRVWTRRPALGHSWG